MILQSLITCPGCGFQNMETMPIDACVHFYQCDSCKIILKPKAGDCCVFCSYGTVRCPSMQLGETIQGKMKHE
jgi:hypothetical protein